MTAEPSARIALEDRATDLAEIGAELVPFLAQVDLRVDPSHARLAPLPLPLEPNTAWHDERLAALWLGPDEWLILSSGDPPEEITARLENSFADVHHSVVDVSANRVAVALARDDRFDLLSHVCSLDLDPAVWGDGRCAQALLGRGQAILHERTGTTGILVRPSSADYLLDLLQEARNVMDVRA